MIRIMFAKKHCKVIIGLICTVLCTIFATVQIFASTWLYVGYKNYSGDGVSFILIATMYYDYFTSTDLKIASMTTNVTNNGNYPIANSYFLAQNATKYHTTDTLLNGWLAGGQIAVGATNQSHTVNWSTLASQYGSNNIYSYTSSQFAETRIGVKVLANSGEYIYYFFETDWLPNGSRITTAYF